MTMKKPLPIHHKVFPQMIFLGITVRVVNDLNALVDMAWEKVVIGFVNMSEME